MIKGLLAFVFGIWAQIANAEVVRLAVTTSFDNSGLADVLLPAIKAQTGLDVQLLVVGTGQALRLGQAGDVDAVLVHSRSAEDAFVAQGHGTHRREIMYNDFVLVGPSGDPAQITTAPTAASALQMIAAQKPAFVSRGDDSGTHKAELRLWAATALDPTSFQGWYREVGAGMGAALNTASAMGAYILSDRASWLNFGNRDGLAVLYSGDPAMFNQYAYLPVNPDKNAYVRHDLAIALEDWLTGPQAAALIDGFKIDGQSLFVFNATPAD